MKGNPKRIWLPIFGVALLVVLAFGVAYLYGFGSAGSGTKAPDTAEVGAPAPDFELESLTGGTIRLSELEGKPVLINFWATWCAPCVLEMPNFQKYYEDYPGQFEVLAINYDESKDAVGEFIRDMGVTFPVLFDDDAKVHAVYRFPGYPTSYIVDKTGVVRFQHIGLMDESTLEKYLTEVGALQ